MAKKPTPKSTSKRPVAAPAKVVKTTPARNTPLPKASSPARREVTREMIAKRAYEIFCGGTGGDQMHNWLRAERELRAGI
jgi:Protein of unknown function (DUF2934)